MDTVKGDNYGKDNICGHGLRIELDREEVFPDDPGQGTPAMVYREPDSDSKWASATYNCAINTGELTDQDGGWVPLTERQVEWLDKQGGKIDEFLEW